MARIQGEVMEKLLLSPEEVADVLGVGRSTVYDLMRLKVLRSVKIGRYRKIPADACRELVNRLVEEQEVA
jgi:excisionase family DNA binding protein